MFAKYMFIIPDSMSHTQNLTYTVNPDKKSWNCSVILTGKSVLDMSANKITDQRT